MTSLSLNDSLRRFRWPRRKTSTHHALQNHSTAAGVLAVSRPILAFSPSQLGSVTTLQESTFVSVYRNTSDAAQTFLPPVQAVADVIPGVGGIIKGVIGGMLSSLQLVDKHIQNKGGLETLRRRLYQLRHHLDNAPTASTLAEENLRWELLSALETAKSELDTMEKRICASPSLTQDIAGCIARINNHLSQYTAFAIMNLQSDMLEVKSRMDMMVQCHAKQIQAFESLRATFGTGRLPASVQSYDHAILIDATGREHPMLLEQCKNLDQLDLMLRVSLFQCEPNEAEIQRWYIERKKYDFVIDNGMSAIQLTRESNIWSNLESGTRIVMRVIMEEEVDSTLSATYKCPCGTPNTVNVSIENLRVALQHGCTITCQCCGRRFQITRTEGPTNMVDGTHRQRADSIPTTGTNCLIRNFLAKQVFWPPTKKHVAFSADGTEGVYEADDWDRSPVAVAQRLTYAVGYA